MNNKGFSKISKIIIFALGFIILLIIYLFLSGKLQFGNQTSTSGGQASKCDPKAYAKGYSNLISSANLNLSSKLPSSYPPGFPEYPKASLIGSVNKQGFTQVYYCTDDTVNVVNDYYLNYSGAYNFQTAPGSETIPNNILLAAFKGNNKDSAAVFVTIINDSNGNMPTMITYQIAD